MTDPVRDALVRIAADHETAAGGHRRRMSRDEIVTLARQVCLAMGWEFGARRTPETGDAPRL
jgi:hypothetical protein